MDFQSLPFDFQSSFNHIKEQVEISHSFDELKERFHSLKPREWNQEYQQLFDRPVVTEWAKKQRKAQFYELISSFEFVAEVLCECIIAQRSEAEKIVPLDKKGGAGGESYIHNGIRIKFARDWLGIYEGNDEGAQKGALREITAMNAVLEANIMHFHIPLTAIFKIRGHCFIASVGVPINETTLLQGSDDRGVSFRESKNKYVLTFLKQFAYKYHLSQSTLVDAFTNQPMATHYGPFDLEIHQSGQDGRFYVVDLQRLMPTSTLNGVRAAWMFEHYRPEFMASQWLSPADSKRLELPSDLLLSHAINQPDEATVQKVHKKFFEGAILELVGKIDSDIQDISLADLSSLFHTSGVNMRFILIVAYHLESNKTAFHLLFTEAVVRALKQYVRKVWAGPSKMGLPPHFTSEEHCLLLLRLLLRNLHSLSDNEFWTEFLARLLSIKYFEEKPLAPVLTDALAHFLSSEEQRSFLLCCCAFVSLYCVLDSAFTRLCDVLGVEKETKLQESEHIWETLISDEPLSHFKLAPKHAIVESRVVELSKMETALTERLDHLRQSGANDAEILDTYFNLLDLYTQSGLPALSLPNGERKIKELREEYKRDANVSYHCALFYHHFGRYGKAHELLCTYHPENEDSLKQPSLESQSLFGDVCVWLGHKRGLTILKQVEDQYAQRSQYDADAMLLNKKRLGAAYLKFGNYTMAEQVLNFQTVEKNPSPALCDVWVTLGRTYSIQQKYEPAQAIFQKVLGAQIAALGETHWSTHLTKLEIGRLCLEKADYPGAEEHFVAALEGLDATLGSYHSLMLRCWRYLAKLKIDQSQFRYAKQYSEHALRLATLSYGDNHMETWRIQRQHSYLLQKKCQDEVKLDEKQQRLIDTTHCILTKQQTAITEIEMLTRVYESQVGFFDKKHPDVLETHFRRLTSRVHPVKPKATKLEKHQWQEEMKSVMNELLQLLKDREEVLGADHHDVFKVMNEIAHLYGYLCNWDEQKRYAILARDGFTELFSALHPQVFLAKNHIAFATSGLGDADAAIELLKEVLEDRKKVFPLDHRDVLDSMQQVAFQKCKCGKADQQAIQFATEVSQKYEVLYGQSHHKTLTARSTRYDCLKQIQGRQNKP